LSIVNAERDKAAAIPTGCRFIGDPSRLNRGGGPKDNYELSCSEGVLDLARISRTTLYPSIPPDRMSFALK